VQTVHFGLGPIGAQILDLALRSPRLRVRGAVDIDPEKAGRDVGSLVGGADTGTRVVTSAGDLPDLAGTGGAALHAAGSQLEKVWPQLRDLLDAGLSVVSTCEELAYPWHRHPELSREIDQYARARGLTVLGTGVNPGFVLDTLTLCATTVFSQVRAVRARRVVDVSTRRTQLQRKVGVGMRRADFERLAEAGEIGHVGLEESARLVAYGLGWQLSEVTGTLAPAIATRAHTVAIGELAPGDVDGQLQTCVATTVDGRRIALDLTMRVEAEAVDEVAIAGDLTGDGELRLTVPGGVAGDTATATIAVNCAARVGTMAPGLLTMADAGLPRGA
jgi:hypothetical protein